MKIKRSIRVWMRKAKSKIYIYIIKLKKIKKKRCIWMKPNKIMGKIKLRIIRNKI